MGGQGVRQLQRRPAGAGDLPSGEPRVHRQGRLDEPERRGRPGRVSGLARGDRLAHDDDQRARRARVGRRWDRGRGRHARPAGLHALATRGRVPALGPAPRGRHGDGPHADGHADAPPARRRRQVRRVLRGRDLQHEPPGPGHDCQHGAGVRGHDGVLPHRRRDARLPPPDEPEPGDGRPRGEVREGPGALPHGRHAGPGVRGHAGTRPWRRRAVGVRSEASARPDRPRRDPEGVQRKPHAPGLAAGLRARRGRGGEHRPLHGRPGQRPRPDAR